MVPAGSGGRRLLRALRSRNVLVGLGIGLAVLTVAVLAVVLGGPDDPSPAAQQRPAAGSGSTTTPTPAPTSTPAGNPDGKLTAQERSRYCRAYAALDARGSASTLDEDQGVDLAELSRTFAAISRDYTAARAVAPATLVPDYSTVLGYLTTARQAVRSKDVDQIKIMVTNLGTLNQYMSRIQGTSQRLCR
jgi:hypothetical protein